MGVDSRLKLLYAKIDSVCTGSLSFTRKEGLSYSDSNSLNINNISAGLKTFIIIKTLLQKGMLEEKGTIILDEPEIHLHPAWQILFAEILVLLQKEFNLHILLTTHSPYFLEAIEVYTKKYGIESKCRYYLAENKGDTAVIGDVTADSEPIYKKLARPFQDLENARHSDD